MNVKYFYCTWNKISIDFSLINENKFESSDIEWTKPVNGSPTRRQ